MRVSQAHIAGIGVTGGSKHTRTRIDKLAISAATKALLDAGVTYGCVDLTVASFLDETRIPPKCLDAFGKHGAPVCQVDNTLGLFTAAQAVKSKQSECVLLLSIDTDEQRSELSIVGMILVSDLFLTSHAYLKDGAVTVSGYSSTSSIYSQSLGGPDFPRTIRTAVNAALRQARIEQRDIQVLEIRNSSDSNTKQALEQFEVAPRISEGVKHTFTGTTGSYGLCGLVWQLRGWANDPPSKALNCLQITLSLDGSANAIVLCRADGRSALTWEEIRNVRDGRERLGYNPAVQTNEITREDLINVSTKRHFVPLDNHGDTLELSVKGGDRAALARL
ncbi:nonspecific lipid-transfer [Lecanosticta acicola]|uniref:Nonspecific lipid-transfer n=1 Tax=Lecanosticta acicola TaxID=111012 RepID=A0AAI8W0E1_9PEZI|nr:nonspecific lipid-transfer [Lecanosticta acicola]